MYKSITVKQIQNLDTIAIRRYGIPSLILMENAGRAVAEEVKKSLRGKKKPGVAVVCGAGNNAGDGFVAARHLINAGIGVKILLIGKGRRLKHDAAVNYRILKNVYRVSKKMKCSIQKNAVLSLAFLKGDFMKRGIKYPIQEVRTAHDPSLQEIARADVVVDAIFGVGLNREIGEPFRGVIETINACAKYVLAVDVPSGLDATTGKIYGVCVKAGKTVTFTFPKTGFFKNNGPRQTGKIVVVDIGIPHACYHF